MQYSMWLTCQNVSCHAASPMAQAKLSNIFWYKTRKYFCLSSDYLGLGLSIPDRAQIGLEPEKPAWITKTGEKGSGACMVEKICHFINSWGKEFKFQSILVNIVSSWPAQATLGGPASKKKKKKKNNMSFKSGSMILLVHLAWGLKFNLQGKCQSSV